jgi:hypothetical protein
MSIWICRWMDCADLDMWMLCMDVNMMFMNIVNVYVCILYCPGFEFLAVELVFSCFCNFFIDSKLIYDG